MRRTQTGAMGVRKPQFFTGLLKWIVNGHTFHGQVLLMSTCDFRLEERLAAANQEVQRLRDPDQVEGNPEVTDRFQYTNI